MLPGSYGYRAAQPLNHSRRSSGDTRAESAYLLMRSRFVRCMTILAGPASRFCRPLGV